MIIIATEKNKVINVMAILDGYDQLFCKNFAGCHKSAAVLQERCRRPQVSGSSKATAINQKEHTQLRCELMFIKDLVSSVQRHQHHCKLLNQYHCELQIIQFNSGLPHAAWR
jgi:hypothetical protein